MRRRKPAGLPDPPELPEAARPRWPAWTAPAAFFSSLGAVIFAGAPLLPAVLVAESNEAVAAIALLVLVLAQDALLVGAAILFALRTLRPRAWHFGLRATRFWPTVGWAALAFVVVFGIEVGWSELVDIDEESLDDDLEGGNVVADIAVALAVIVVAPVTEEFFFRGFFYRALRSRFRLVAAVLIDSAVFTVIHLQYIVVPLVFPLIFVFAVSVCLVYERTGSLFAVICVHAAFNAAASLGSFPVVAIVVALLVFSACMLVARRLGPAPSPFAPPAAARA